MAKTKNSIGCIININDIEFFNQSNKDFIRLAMKTSLMSNMRRAHSKGVVDYIFSEYEEEMEFKLPNIIDFLEVEKIKLNKAKNLSQKERLEILNNSSKKPKQTIVKQTVFLRNQFVVAEVLYRANGYCEVCKSAAPFLRDLDNTPYLEVHHIRTLSEGGDDKIENAIGLCPNCHRKAHYGNKENK